MRPATAWVQALPLAPGRPGYVARLVSWSGRLPRLRLRVRATPATECRACGEPTDGGETCWRCAVHGTAPVAASYHSDGER